MARKLVTREDPAFVHKALGAFALLHYAYRFANYLLRGDMMFSAIGGGATALVAIAAVCSHGLLSASSFIFHIPAFRNRQAPMIFPEFRMHSILFTWRSIACFLIHFHRVPRVYACVACGVTMLLADAVTANHNRGGGTMRNMPFDECISREDRERITLMHSSMQIRATMFMLCNVETAFSPMFSIQIAAFLMTLVRKNIIGARDWHVLYAIALWINALLYLSRNMPIDFLCTQWVLYTLYTKLFFRLRTNKYLAWSITFGLFLAKDAYFPAVVGAWVEERRGMERVLRVVYLVVLFGLQLQKTRALFASHSPTPHSNPNPSDSARASSAANSAYTALRSASASASASPSASRLKTVGEASSTGRCAVSMVQARSSTQRPKEW